MNLVYADEYGIKGSNFYWHKFAAHGLFKEDIISAGVVNDRVQIDKSLIEPLLAINKELASRGWELYLKEGLRPKALYEIVYKRRIENYGKEETDSILNMKDIPHSRGTAVDVAIWDKATDKEIYLREGKDGTPALFLDFYKNKETPEAKKYQELQDYLLNLITSHGFKLGTRREYFHFELAV